MSMGWNRQDDFHNSRVYGADEPSGGGVLGWLKRQFDKLLRGGGEPGPAAVLLTHALDDQLSGLAADGRDRQRTTLPHTTPLEDPRR